MGLSAAKRSRISAVRSSERWSTRISSSQKSGMFRHAASSNYVRSRLRNAARVREVPTAIGQALLGEPELEAAFHNVEHHQAHVASAFFVSPFERAAVLS